MRNEGKSICNCCGRVLEQEEYTILKNSGDIFLTGMEQFREEKYARNVLNGLQKHSKYHSKRSY